MREADLQKIYNEWRKTVTIEGIPFTWLGKEENIEAFSRFANLDKPVDFGQMLDLEGNYDSEECNMFEVKKIYKTKEDYNLEDGSFIKSGTSFFVISKDRYGYNIIFENNDKCYFEHDSRKYYIDELELELFADSSKVINKKILNKREGIKIKDKNVIEFLGKDSVVINKVSKDELNEILDKNKSYSWFKINNKNKITSEDFTNKNYIAALKEKEYLKDIYIKKNYDLNNLVYVDDNKKLYLVKNTENKTDKEIEPFYNLDKIKEIPLEDVCNRLGVNTSSKGKKLWCNIRGEKTPSCCINIDKNYWYDFGTAKGGDVIKFVSEVEKINSKEAIYKLADMFGIESENTITNKNKYNLYISNSDYRKIGIEPTRATLNLDINLEKQNLDEVIKLEKAFSKSMNELANSNEDLFLEVLNKKSIPIVYNNIKNYYDCLSRIEDYINEKGNILTGFHSLETQLYMNYSKELADTLNNQLDILSKTNIDKIVGFEIKENKVDFQKHMNDIFSVCLENGVEVLSQESPEYNKVIKNLDEFKEYILDYKVPELGDVEIIEEKVSKIEKEFKSYTYIDLINWCDDNDIELVPLRKEKTIEVEKEITETKILPKMRM
ncbi:CHC2 zinc finger domain-containing protein [Clostridium perfringens]|uniref:CHC2 zinc finger domain-containing protein n=1 Tax=Clostridium perfringens TaxID=1502 RepID=UPI0028CEA21C|nr:CHC2 zinc finger domain-containing protein [Clostridium perfringens]MDK0553538.1 CHC2 zinc finger domain-containing protein [Clostridium perfringens]MDT7932586.1 CHC2 zinc finger domain-containing protein [Clostridium perfringens]MDT7956663.1 CHC2 zinc finger domain-containing protein [Clostridium perfringens]